MDRGRVAEFDTPANLLANPTGVFSQMVEGTGPAAAAWLRQAAQGDASGSGDGSSLPLTARRVASTGTDADGNMNAGAGAGAGAGASARGTMPPILRRHRSAPSPPNLSRVPSGTVAPTRSASAVAARLTRLKRLMSQ